METICTVTGEHTNCNGDCSDCHEYNIESEVSDSE